MTSTDNTQEPDVEEIDQIRSIIWELSLDMVQAGQSEPNKDSEEVANHNWAMPSLTEKALNQLILKARVKELEYVLDNVYWPIEGDRQHILDRVSELNSNLKRTSGGGDE